MSKKMQDSIWCLRGIGALSIILYHYAAAYDMYISDVFSLFDFGLFTYAVPMFFIFSGIFLYKKVVDFKEPLKLIVYRITRLLPAYWFGVCYSSIILRVLLKEKRPKLFEIIINLTMIEDLFGVENIDGVYWTMYYEVMLLVVFTMLTLLLKHLQMISISKITDCFCSIWMLLGAAFQFIFNFFCGGGNTYDLMAFTGPYVPMFILGVLICKRYILREEVTIHMKINFVVLCCYWMVFRQGKSLAIGIFAMMAVLLVCTEKIVLKSRLLMFIGHISYPLYLCHNLLGRFVCISLRDQASGYTVGMLLVMAAVFSIFLAFIVSRYEVLCLGCIQKSGLYKKIMSQ